MALIDRKYGFENYADEADITTTGGGADDDNFSAVTKGASSIIKADTAWSARGGKSVRIDAAAVQTAYVAWSGLTAETTKFARLYFKSPSAWSAINYLMIFTDVLSGAVGRLHIAPATQKITVVNSSGTILGTLDYALATDTAYRLEVKFFSHVMNGTVDVRLYAGHSTAALATLSLINQPTDGDNITGFAVGQFLTTASNPDAMWFDDIAIGNTDWIGPSVVTHELEATLLGDSSLEAVMTLQQAIAATASGDSELPTPALLKDVLMDATLAGDSDGFEATLVADYTLDAQLDGDSTLEADVEFTSVNIEAQLDSDSLVEATASVEIVVEADVMGDSSIEATVTDAPSLDVQLDGDSSIEADMLKDVTVSIELVGDSNVEADLVKDLSITADLFGDSNLIATLHAVWSLQPVVLSGDSTLEGGAPIIFTPVGLVRLYLPPEYRVVIADLTGTPMEEVPASALNCSFVLNDVGHCGFELPKYHSKSTPELIAPGKREIHVYRGGEFFWGGRLWNVNASTGRDTIQVSGDDWLSVLRRRLIVETLNYEELDQLDIAWQIINWMQNQPDGDVGIVRDNPAEASGELVTVKFSEWERISVADALKGLTEDDNSFDYQLTPDKRWKTFYPRRGTDTNIIMELGKNIEELSFDKDAAELASRMHGLGGGTDRNRCIAVATDLDSLLEYGLLESYVDYSELNSYPRLTRRASQELKLVRNPLWQPTVTAITDDPAWEDYELGDRMRLVANDGWIRINDMFRLIGLNVRWTEEGAKEAVDMYFDEATAAS